MQSRNGLSGFVVAAVTAAIMAVTGTMLGQSNTWSAGAPMPTARLGAAFGVIKGKVYVVTGATSSAIVNNNEIYNPAKNTWTSGTPIPTGRYVPASAVVNNILYVIGGCNSGCTVGGGALTVVEAYNPATDSWSTKSPLPTATDSVYAIANKGLIYVVGGYVQGPGRVATVYVYNPVSDSWTQAASMKVAKSNPALGVLGGIISAGGYANNNQDTNDNESYSTGKNTWKTVAPIPTARAGSCFGVYKGKFYVAGGAGGGDGNTPADVLEDYVGATKSWGTLASMPQAVIAPASAMVKGKLYCVGGANSGYLFEGVPVDNVQIYHP